MTTNIYVNNATMCPAEQDLAESLVIESIQFNGMDLYYIPKEVINLDLLYKEDMVSRLGQAYKLEMYMDDEHGRQENQDILTKFGVQILASIDFTFSKKRFGEVVTTAVPSIKTPREGDLVYSPIHGFLYEITYVNTDKVWYQFGKNYIYTISTQLMQYSSEDINTTIPTVDLIATEHKNLSDALTDQYARNDTLKTEGDTIIDPSVETDNVFGAF